MWRFWALGLLALCGCTTTQQANDVMASQFIGMRTDDFFISHGPPVAEHKLDDGRMMYLWSEGGRDIHMPGQSSGTITMIGNTAWWNGWSSPGTDIHIECQVRLVSRNGLIESILTQKDSVGWWEMSRCHELFKIKKRSI